MKRLQTIYQLVNQLRADARSLRHKYQTSNSAYPNKNPSKLAPERLIEVLSSRWVSFQLSKA